MKVKQKSPLGEIVHWLNKNTHPDDDGLYDPMSLMGPTFTLKRLKPNGNFDVWWNSASLVSWNFF